jgi:hypothetical protein
VTADLGAFRRVLRASWKRCCESQCNGDGWCVGVNFGRWYCVGREGGQGGQGRCEVSTDERCFGRHRSVESR